MGTSMPRYEYEASQSATDPHAEETGGALSRRLADQGLSDGLARTIPLWAAVMNHIVLRFRQRAWHEERNC
jgi:hypothetical protein